MISACVSVSEEGSTEVSVSGRSVSVVRVSKADSVSAMVSGADVSSSTASVCGSS